MTGCIHSPDAHADGPCSSDGCRCPGIETHGAIVAPVTMLPSPSRLDLAFACIGSFLLERVEHTSDASEMGTLVHRFLQRVPELGRVEALAEIDDDEKMRVCAAIELDGMPIDPARFAAEVTLAWNPRTGETRELGRGLTREAVAAFRRALVGWYIGTLDLLSLLGVDRVFVGDYKTGKSRLPPPSKHRQIRAYAFMAAKHFGRGEAWVEIIRPQEDGPPIRQWAVLDMFDLAAIEVEMAQLAERIFAGGEPQLVMGAHCARCDAISNCRPQLALASSLGQDPAVTLRRGVLELLSPSTETEAFEAFFAVKANVKEVERALRLYSAARYAAGHPVRLRDGQVYGPRPVVTKKWDGDVAFDVLLERHGVDVASKSVQKKTSAKAITLALKPKAPKRGIAKFVAAAIAHLKERGAYLEKPGVRFEVHTLPDDWKPPVAALTPAAAAALAAAVDAGDSSSDDEQPSSEDDA